ncbi:MAG: NfeD family protein [Lachnospiraceae bacterium]|nr:NfeD family protein [Lachnospiraceae bacterium]
MMLIWLALVIVLIVIEIFTVGLTTIWFAGGALAAIVINLLGLGMVWQIIAFLVVSGVLLFFTRPWALKYINSNRVKTNYEGVIGKVIRITEIVDNMNQTGKAVVNGQEWSVRSEQDKVILGEGTLAKVVKIEGVKLIVRVYEEE